MKKELVIYRDLLTACKAVKATYNDDGVPNKSVWRIAKRVITRAHAELGYGLALELQARAMTKSGINSAQPFASTAFDWNSLENFGAIK